MTDDETTVPEQPSVDVNVAAPGVDVDVDVTPVDPDEDVPETRADPVPQE